MEKCRIYFPQIFSTKLSCDVEVSYKPRTKVRGTLRTSKSPNKLQTLVRSKTQGLFDTTVRSDVIPFAPLKREYTKINPYDPKAESVRRRNMRRC